VGCFTKKEIPKILRGIPEHRLVPMPEPDMRSLLFAAAATTPAPHVGARLIAESEGNPLALLEYLASLSPRGRAAAHGVLEHGAWANSASWNGVMQRPQAAGYTVDVPPNPLQGLAYDPAYLADFLHTITGPIILVGHSYGGAVITNAATRNPQVKALVYVDAFIPNQNQTIGQLVTAVPGSCVAAPPATIFNFATFPGAPACRAAGRVLRGSAWRSPPPIHPGHIG
jgi:pimeloyl-ACP methyl ester carboxylesterase